MEVKQKETGRDGLPASPELPDFASHALKPPPDGPPPLDGVKAFLSAPPAAPIPITRDALSFARLHPEVQQHFAAASGRLANAVACSLVSPLFTGPSEMWTVCAENAVVISLLLVLDSVAPMTMDSRLGLVAERCQGGTASYTAVGSPLRPGGVLREAGGLRLLARWEDRAAGGMQQAVADLHRATGAWSPLYYGE
ncbi:hypothetical protein GPECTOR_35g868 [Gonium pectorale]|uniref:Uncharacterized protein n=1 Tax=Gonium pectorale TaxID=33097 RepID=A0A150GDL4_GONPE|nr:hypothetical protein GPECTOR_35g868 [Gonium pectorale]|eukprot:KXZ47430.1 hypothetical protein GPECTOR_35g868 [Gonium pectorale]